jgi:hypothetical protein
MPAVARDRETDLTLCIHPHPTLSETISEAAETLHGLASHFFVAEKKVV